MRRTPLKRKTRLKRKPWRKALGFAEQRLRFKQAVLEADGDCVMLGVSLCDGPLQACHIVPKTKLRRLGYGAETVYAVEAAFTSCYRHHRRHDAFIERIPDSLIPKRCRIFRAIVEERAA